MVSRKLSFQIMSFEFLSGEDFNEVETQLRVRTSQLTIAKVAEAWDSFTQEGLLLFLLVITMIVNIIMWCVRGRGSNGAELIPMEVGLAVTSKS